MLIGKRRKSLSDSDDDPESVPKIPKMSPKDQDPCKSATMGQSLKILLMLMIQYFKLYLKYMQALCLQPRHVPKYLHSDLYISPQLTYNRQILIIDIYS